MNITQEMESQQLMKLAKEIEETFDTLDVTFDERYNTVYIHKKGLEDDERLLKLREKYQFNLSNGIFVL